MITKNFTQLGGKSCNKALLHTLGPEASPGRMIDAELIEAGLIDTDLFEGAPCGLAIVALNGRILRANRMLRAWIGDQGRSPVGQTLPALLAGEGLSFFASLIDGLRLDDPVEEVFALLQRGNGAMLPVYLNAVLRRGVRGKSAEDGDLIHISFVSGWHRTEYEAELRRGKRAAEQLAAIVSHSSDAIVSVTPGGRILNANRAFSEIFQFEPHETIGAVLAELIVPEQARAQFAGKLRAAEQGPVKGEIVRRRRKDGVCLDFSLSMAPICNDEQQVVAISAIYRDVTPLTKAAEHIEFLLREVNHRSKNMLAVVQAVARQTARHAEGPEAFTDGFMARLAAIGASHDMLVSRDWRGVQIGDLTRIQCGQLGEEAEARIAVSGDLIEINPRAAESYGLALHELATNAVRYGALSAPDGHVELSFAIDVEAKTYCLTWREHGGPPVCAPQRKGFGASVLMRAAPQSIEGESHLDFLPDGLTYTLRAPLAQIVMSGAE